MRKNHIGEACIVALTAAIKQERISFAWLGLFDQITQKITNFNSLGQGEEFSLEIRDSINKPKTSEENIFRKALRLEQPISCVEIMENSKCQSMQVFCEVAGWRSVAALPIFVADKLVALLTVFSFEVDTFNNDYLQHLVSVVNHTHCNTPSSNTEYKSQKLQKNELRQHSNDNIRTKLKKKDTVISRVDDILDRISDGIVALDNNWCYNYLNQRAAEMLQRDTPEELLGKNIWEEYPDGVGRPFYHAYFKAFETQLPIIFEDHYQPWDLWFENRIYPSKNGITVYFTDITERKRIEAKMEKMAHFDSLTGLPNRVMLKLRLDHALKMAKREKGGLALLMLDLDHFKDVNDSFGHAAGDMLLKKIATVLRKRFRNVDTVSRLGGDEFTILLEDLDHREDAAKIAVEIINLLKQPWHLNNNIEVRIGASIGISLYPEHGHTSEDLIQYADTSLYEAKSAGRGEYKYYNHKLTQKVRTRIELETKLRAAIKNNELVVYFQPQIDIRSNSVIGAEALVRWNDPKEGLIFPDLFISIAEQSGLIVEIGNIVLRKTCLQGKRWIDAGHPPLCLAVNLSAQQFLHSDIVNVVTKILQSTGFPAEYLELEITESALMERESEAIEILQYLRKMGIRIAIDDFGTGYSSLSYLKKLPIDLLKIDKSFIDDIPNSQDDMAIAATIIAMAKILKLKVLAEGVETEQQLAFLEKEQCDFFQGYLVSPAVSIEEFEKLLILKSQ